MDYNGFISTVRERAHVPDDEAQRAACATLLTLSERLTGGEAEDIANLVPQELRRCVVERPTPERFHVDEFLRRVAERTGISESSAEVDARAVLAALWSTVGPREFAEMRAELPKDFDPLLDQALVEAPRPERQMSQVDPVIGFDELLDRVAEELGGDRDQARRATGAVLEVLASRVTGGQVDDIEARLPAELRPAFERGRARSGGKAKPVSLEEFITQVARAETVDPGTATEHARAVLSVLREVLPEKEWADTRAQLPADYRVFWTASG